MSEKDLITVAGMQKLVAELKQLKDVEHPQIIEMVAEARSHGDLKENAEYHSARERQNYIEARMGTLETMAMNAEVVDVATLADKGDNVFFGAVVKVLDLNTDKEMEFQIVGVHESNVENHKISYKSPLGGSLIGKTVGDVASVRTPSGLKEYEILEVLYK